MEIPPTYGNSPVNLWFDLKQIATEFSSMLCISIRYPLTISYVFLNIFGGNISKTHASENPIIGQNSAMEHPNLTNKVSSPMFSRVRILIKTCLRQCNAGN